MLIFSLLAGATLMASGIMLCMTADHDSNARRRRLALQYNQKLLEDGNNNHSRTLCYWEMKDPEQVRYSFSVGVSVSLILTGGALVITKVVMACI
jgi:hypothetical protein